MTYEQVVEALKDILNSIKKESKRLPVFYFVETDNELRILVTQRHKKFYERSDWIIYGKKLKN